MAGFDNEVLYAQGIDLSGTPNPSNKLNQDGYIYIGNSSGNPVAALPDSPDSIVSITGGPGSLSISAGTGLTDNFLQVANNLSDVDNNATARNNLGLGSIATQSAANVNITGGNITGITDLAVADGGSGRSSATAYAVICGGTAATSAHQSIASVGTSGQVLTSNGAGALPTFQDATGGGGLTWNAIAGTTQTAAVNNGYIVSNASQTTITLPTTAAVGDVIRVAGYGAGGWIIDYGTSQLIHFLGTNSTTTTGNLTSTHRYDAVELLCTVTDNEWNVISSMGNITVN